MKHWIAILFVFCAGGPLVAQESLPVDSMEDLSLWTCSDPPEQIAKSVDTKPAKGKGALHLVIPGRAHFLANFTPKTSAAWNEYDGFAFQVKGDGSENWGEIVIQVRNAGKPWAAAFPLKDTDWHEVRLAWADLVPAHATLPSLNATDKVRPADISQISFGKGFSITVRHESPPIAFSVDDLRLVKGIVSSRTRVDVAKLPPVADVVNRMKAGEAVTILALGDSITWGMNVNGNSNAYPAILEGLLRKRFGNEKITVINRGIGGSTTAFHRRWLGRDVKGVEADLVTIMFGYNEMPSKVEDREAASKTFVTNLVTYAQEIAGVMKKPPALVLLATIPGKDRNWESLDCYADAVRAFGKAHPNVTIADVNGVFKALGKEKYAELMSDEAHPNRAGQRAMAEVVFEAITGEKPAE